MKQLGMQKDLLPCDTGHPDPVGQPESGESRCHRQRGEHDGLLLGRHHVVTVLVKRGLEQRGEFPGGTGRQGGRGGGQTSQSADIGVGLSKESAK